MSEPKHGDIWPPRWPDITDRAVLAALATVSSHLFVPPQHRELA